MSELHARLKGFTPQQEEWKSSVVSHLLHFIYLIKVSKPIFLKKYIFEIKQNESHPAFKIVTCQMPTKSHYFSWDNFGMTESMLQIKWHIHKQGVIERINHAKCKTSTRYEELLKEEEESPNLFSHLDNNIGITGTNITNSKIDTPFHSDSEQTHHLIHTRRRLWRCWWIHFIMPLTFPCL